MYQKIIIEAINYIKDNLEEDIKVDDVAKHCNFSKYYFNRVFKNEVGESIYTFIKRLRLEKSAMDIIIDGDISITQAGAVYGYSSSNYSVAFKNHYSASPKVYKEAFTRSSIKSTDNYFADLSGMDFEYFDKQMEKVVLDDRTVIYERYMGDYIDLDNKWNEFLEKYKKYYDKDSLSIEITNDDPIITQAEKCIIDLCMTTNKIIDIPYNTQVIKGGNYFLYHLEGTNEDIFEKLEGIVSIWMPKSKVKFDLDNRKIFNIIKLANKEKNHYIFDVYIPYKK